MKDIWTEYMDWIYGPLESVDIDHLTLSRGNFGCRLTSRKVSHRASDVSDKFALVIVSNMPRGSRSHLTRRVPKKFIRGIAIEAQDALTHDCVDSSSQIAGVALTKGWDEIKKNENRSLKS